MVFFLVFYAILTYALVFTAQHSVTLAAQDGARKVLQWQPGAASLAVRANAGRGQGKVDVQAELFGLAQVFEQGGNRGIAEVFHGFFLFCEACLDWRYGLSRFDSDGNRRLASIGSHKC